ncbi:Tryptophan synthase beta chain [Wickerhamomyces ciferrii]|uniref:L-serine ammonia-lyase n=2 Tax=Wickerhamomyces ciferrii TaxID=1041607 RepID=K0KA51_WICCF|nr:Tryptophan synthase beta chain [Wickerhamomyces ciferrii]AEX09413.1 L-serine deaminase [Wickerhamomyces ciferrii]CCH41800.1 Tryptophan synthase beta chain [Wickerhamomyces ciferrii]
MTITKDHKVPYIKTPLVDCKELSEQSPCRIFLKQEFIQPSGSYKIRGLSNLIRTSIEEIKSNPNNLGKTIHVYAASGGNAGNAVSCASQFYGLESTVVIPKATSDKMKQKIFKNGSKIIVQGETIGEAAIYLKDVLIPSLDDSIIPIYCHPYDIPAIWHGHSSIIDEIVDQLASSNELSKLKGIVCSIGGGGLYNGLVQGLQRNQLSKIPIMTLETDTCPTFHESIKAQKQVFIKKTNTIAISLACPYVSLKTLEYYNSHKTKNLLVSDSDAANSCLNFANEFNIIVEPACGVALCSVYNNLIQKNIEFFDDLKSDDIVVIIVCGGSSTTVQDLTNYKLLYH